MLGPACSMQCSLRIVHPSSPLQARRPIAINVLVGACRLPRPLPATGRSPRPAAPANVQKVDGCSTGDVMALDHSFMSSSSVPIHRQGSRRHPAQGIVLGIETSGPGGFERIYAEWHAQGSGPQNGSGKPDAPRSRASEGAGNRGVEPRVAVLETTVLPIHQSPVGGGIVGASRAAACASACDGQRVREPQANAGQCRHSSWTASRHVCDDAYELQQCLPSTAGRRRAALAVARLRAGRHADRGARQRTAHRRDHHRHAVRPRQHQPRDRDRPGTLAGRCPGPAGRGAAAQRTGRETLRTESHLQSRRGSHEPRLRHDIHDHVDLAVRLRRDRDRLLHIEQTERQLPAHDLQGDVALDGQDQACVRDKHHQPARFVVADRPGGELGRGGERGNIHRDRPLAGDHRTVAGNLGERLRNPRADARKLRAERQQARLRGRKLVREHERRRLLHAERLSGRRIVDEEGLQPRARWKTRSQVQRLDAG